jgi:hypothetical protein
MRSPITRFSKSAAAPPPAAAARAAAPVPAPRLSDMAALRPRANARSAGKSVLEMLGMRAFWRVLWLLSCLLFVSKQVLACACLCLPVIACDCL